MWNQSVHFDSARRGRPFSVRKLRDDIQPAPLEAYLLTGQTPHVLIQAMSPSGGHGTYRAELASA